jgi:hypothetical protein
MSYNLESPKELYDFSSDCEEACCVCPQYQPWNPIDFDADRNEVSPYDVFIYWKNGNGGDLLFRLGYYTNLSQEAEATFERYATIQLGIKKEPDILDLNTNKTLSKDVMSILKFCQGE